MCIRLVLARAAVCTAACLACLSIQAVTLAQSTAFTYQGELKQGGNAANGTYDMRFRLYSAPVGGSQPGPTACIDNVAVSNGKFAATIDLGQQYATGEARYLEIEVRQDTGLNCSNTTGFTLLTPRQLLTAAPKASVAEIAHSLAIPNGSSLNAVALDNSGNVGMGTASPTSHLDIFGVQDALKLRGPQPFMTLVDTSSNTRVLLQNEGGRYFVVSESFLNGTNTGGFTMVDQQGRLGLGTFNPASTLDVSGNASISGFVGIGTTAPAAKLDVRGDVKLGSSGQYYAPAGEENLRIIRGTISSGGITIEGSGFTPTQQSTGHYHIQFTIPFAFPPSVTLSVVTTGDEHAFQAEIRNAISTTGFDVITNRSDTGDYHSMQFTMIAVGPR
jgi:hypothetical protein